MVLQVVDLVKEPRRHVPKVDAVLLVGFSVGKRKEGNVKLDFSSQLILQVVYVG